MYVDLIETVFVAVFSKYSVRHQTYTLPDAIDETCAFK
jgi:hypothetical protein